MCNSVFSSHAHMRLNATDGRPRSFIEVPHVFLKLLLQKQVKTKDVKEYTLIPNVPRKHPRFFWLFLASPNYIVVTAK